MKRLLVFVYIVVSQTRVCLTGSESRIPLENITAACREPIGLMSGKVKDDQITAFSAYNGDFNTYGAHRARLNLTSWPPGHRADPSQKQASWLKIELKENMIITGIATQGYGDPKAAEWVKQFMVLYSIGDDYLYFKNEKGELKIFSGNRDGNSVKRNEVPVPTIARSLMVMPFQTNNNFAIRMELFGCEPGYYFIIGLMVQDTYFKTDYVDPTSSAYQYMSTGTKMEIGYALEGIPGFLGASVQGFSPQKNRFGELNLEALVKIDSIEASVHYITTALKNSIAESFGMFDQSYMIVRYPLDVMCRPPEVTLKLNKTVSQGNVFYITESNLLTVDVRLHCNSTTKTIYSWEVSRVDPRSNRLMPPDTFGLGTTEFIVRPRVWPLGLAYVRFMAKMVGEEGATNQDYGFVNVTLPPLVARIVGAKETIKGTGNVHLDASSSFDPYSPWLKTKGFTLIWLCRRQNENFDNVNMSNPIDVAIGKKEIKGGCYGSGPGVINVTRPTLEMKIGSMASKETYVIRLIIRKGPRETIIDHSLRINSSLTLSLRCTLNCAVKVSTTMRMVVESSCKGRTCKAVHSYRWFLYTVDPMGEKEGWFEVDDLQEKIITELDSPSIVFIGRLNPFFNSLEDEQPYRLKIVATLSDGSSEESEPMEFITNSAPYPVEDDDGCFIKPENGSAVTTEFVIWCKGFEDEDLPLQYEFRYHTNIGMVVMEKSSKSNISTRLPLGEAEVDYTIAIEIYIIDSLGASYMDFLPVTVMPMAATDVSNTLLALTSGTNSAMGNLMKSGDVGKAAQMAYAVLSLVDQSKDGIKSKDKKSLKEGIINQISGVQVKSLEEITQVAAVIALATGEKDEISQSSQEAAVNLLENTANFMFSQKGTGDPVLVQKVGESLLYGIGNLMSAGSSEAKDEDATTDRKRRRKPDKSNAEKKKRGKEMAQKTLNLMETVSGSLLATKVVGEKPTTIKTKSLALVLDRQTPSKMGGKTIGEGGSNVALPSAGTLFGNTADDMPAVDSQLLAFKDNPYTWDSSANDVKSSVVDFSLKAVDGKALEVSGLSKPVELYIPQKTEDEPKDSNASQPEPEAYFAKPSKGAKNIRSHQITIPSEDSAVSVKIKPQAGKSIEVYVRRLAKPTLEKYKIKKIIPDYSTCQNYTPNVGYFNCTDDPYTLTLFGAATGGIGLHFIGVRYFVGPNEAPTSSGAAETNARVRRDCYSHNGRMKRGCVGVKDPPTTQAPTPLIIIPIYNASTDVNYTMKVSVSKCLYWSKSKSKWTGDGCTVGPNSDAINLHCLCTHLSAFGGDFFVAPNPIDFDKVFAEFGRMGETGNFVVLATVCGLLGLFCVGLVVARRADKKDELKVVANMNLAESREDGYAYQISVQTGMWRGYGTTANVGLSIFGEEGKTGDIPLTDPSSEKIFFARGSVNNFTLVLPDTLGELLKVKIWHDNSGNSPSWFFHQVMVVDAQTGKKWYFLANRWLAVEKGDGNIDIEIPCAEKKDLSGFRNLFYSRTARSLGEGHLWLSVFTRPPHNTFTRCQRLGCCLSLLFAAMVTNAMFYQFGADPKDQFQIGPLKLSFTQIKIGIQSSIVAVPVNILIVTIFRNIRPKIPGDESGVKPPGCLPHFVLYFGWILCILTSLAAAMFTVFYSLMWGADTSNQWLTSIMVSFFQDVIITQPLKVVAIASLLSLVIKKPPEQDKVLGASLSKNKDGEGNIVAPEGNELERQRIYRTKVMEMFRTMVEIIFFVVFILLIVVVCYGNRKSTRYLMTEGMEHVFSGFEKVSSPQAFWKWTKKKLLPALFDAEWYNGQPFEYAEGFISTREGFVVGMPRLRQVRISPDPACPVDKDEPFLAHMFSRCLPLYVHEKEDTTPYSMPGWKPVRNLTKSMSIFKLRDMCPKPWRYQSATDLHSLSFRGLTISYDGGGFVADLGYNSWQAFEVVENLENNNWIDDKTVAVFVEFTIFEPTTSLFSAVKYLYERFRTGGTNVRPTVKTLVLYSSSDVHFKSLFQVCQLMLMLMIIFFLFVEFGKVYRQGRVYLKQFWNWMELIQIFSTVAAIVMFFFKEKFTSEFVQRVQENPFETSSTDYIVLWSDLEIYLLSLVIFVVTIKFLRLIRFNRSICQMTGTITRSAKSIASFFIVFIAVLLAFTQLGFLAFGASLPPYSSFFQSMRSVLQMLLGGEMHFHQLQTVNKILGPLFAFVYMVTMTMILLNMFLAILNDSYEETKQLAGGEFADADLAEFMGEYFGTHIGYLRDGAQSTVKKLVALFLSKLRPSKKEKIEEYSKINIEESVTKIEVYEENEVDSALDVLSVEKIHLASLESFDDLFSDDETCINDLKRSVDELRKSVVSLKTTGDEKEKTPSLVQNESKCYEPSIKWDSPIIPRQSESGKKPGSIFDWQPMFDESRFMSQFDQPKNTPSSIHSAQYLTDRPSKCTQLDALSSISDTPSNSISSNVDKPSDSGTIFVKPNVYNMLHSTKKTAYIILPTEEKDDDEEDDNDCTFESTRLVDTKSPTIETASTSVNEEECMCE